MAAEQQETPLVVSSIHSKLLEIIITQDFKNESLHEFETILKLGVDINFLNKNGSTLLLTAVQNKKRDWIAFLLDNGANPDLEFVTPDGDIQTATDIAWQIGAFDIVLQLLERDSAYPDDFDEDKLSEDEKIDFKRFVKSRDVLHGQIRSGDLEAVKKFVEENPRVKYAYNFSIQCTLSTALESKNFEIYSFLRSKGFSKGLDSNFNDILENLNDGDKTQLKFTNRKYFHTNDSEHIMELLSKSRLGFGSSQTNYEKIQKWFEALDKIPEVQAIMKVIANAPKLDIVFDFNRGTVCDMDPTQPRNCVFGRAIYKVGNILIGAKRKDESDVLATIAHEFTHYAMHVVYHNLGKPFHKSDVTRIEEFDEIVKLYNNQSMLSIESVISDAFDYEEDEFSKELIARVPQLMALHKTNPEKLLDLKKSFKRLFNFFKENLKDFEKEIPLMKQRQKLEDLNKTGICSKLLNSKNYFKQFKIKLQDINTDDNVFIYSQLPELAMQNLIPLLKTENFREIDSMHIFVRIDQLLVTKVREKIKFIFNSSLKPKLVVLDYVGVETESISEVLSQMASQGRTIFCSDRSNDFPFFPKKLDVNFVWDDLKYVSKVEILRKHVVFQGLKVTLNEILKVESSFFLELPLEDILKVTKMKLSCFDNFLPLVTKVFIARRFERHKKSLTVKEIVKSLNTEKPVVIADSAGMGKTTSAKHFATVLKEQNPTSLVLFIDLKQHTAVYMKDNEQPFGEINLEFLARNLLKLEGKLEKKLFEHFYKTRKTIFVIDGFDEISPKYKNFVLKMIRTIQDSRNCLLATTRTHLAAELENALGTTAIKFLPLNNDEQIDFLVQLWLQANPEALQLNLKAKKLLEKSRKELSQKDFLKVPLHLYMLAELYKDQDLDSFEEFQLNLFNLFEHFVSTKIDVWGTKLPLASDDDKNFRSKCTIFQIHHKLACEYFFGKDDTKSLLFTNIDESITNDMIMRFGLVIGINKDEIQFAHQMFAEYFLAHYFCTDIKEEVLTRKSEALSNFFLDILLNEDFYIVRKFVNDKITEVTAANGLLPSKIEQMLVMKNSSNILERLINQKLSNVITFILKTLNISRKTKLRLLKHVNSKQKKNVLHMALHCVETFRIIWEGIKSVADEQGQKDFFTSIDATAKTILVVSVEHEFNDTLQYVLEVAKTLLSSEEFVQFLLKENSVSYNSLFVCIIFGRGESFDIIWSAAKQKLSIDDQRKYLEGRSGPVKMSILHFMAYCKNKKCLRYLLKAIKEVFSEIEMSKFLLHKDCEQDTFLHYVARQADLECITIVLKFCSENLRKNELKLLLLAKDRFLQNVFHLSLENEGKTVRKFLLEVARQNLTSLEFRTALIARDCNGSNFLVGLTTEDFNELFSEEERQLLQEDFKNSRCFVSETVKELRSLMAKIESGLLSPKELKQLLNKKFRYDTPLFILAVLEATEENLVHLTRELRSKLNQTEIFDLFTFENVSGDNILQSCALLNHRNTEVLWKLVTDTLEVSNIKMLLQKTNKLGYTVIMVAAVKDNTMLMNYLEWCQTSFEQKALKKLLMLSDKFSETLINKVSRKCSQHLAQNFFDFILLLFSKQEIKSLIFKENNHGQTPLYSSLLNKDVETVKVVWEVYRITLDLKEFEDKLLNGRIDYFKKYGRNDEAVEMMRTLAINLFGKEKCFGAFVSWEDETLFAIDTEDSEHSS